MQINKNLSFDIETYLKQCHPDVSSATFYEDGTVLVETVGDCAGCPYGCFEKNSQLLEAVTTRYPQVRQVKTTPAVSQELLQLAKQFLGTKSEVK